MNIKQVLDAAPPTPACFSSRTVWSEFLSSAQRGGAKPFMQGVYRPKFNYCSECTRDFKAGMQEVGKCDPNKFRVLVVVKEVA